LDSIGREAEKHGAVSARTADHNEAVRAFKDRPRPAFSGPWIAMGAARKTIYWAVRSASDPFYRDRGGFTAADAECGDTTLQILGLERACGRVTISRAPVAPIGSPTAPAPGAGAAG
jgi:hypothetical protein